MSVLIDSWLAKTTRRLRNAGITTGRLDALILLEDATGRDRGWLLAHGDEPFEEDAALTSAVVRRARHEPLAYIRGHVEFYGHDFIITPDVLVPRPETEAVVELARQIAVREHLTSLIDVGTGSGCIALSLALALPGCRVAASDISPAALAVARRNSRRLDGTVQFYEADLLGAGLPPADIVATNLPYVPDELPINRAARAEPRLALFAGPDGLNAYRRLWQQITNNPVKPRVVITESLPDQHARLAQLAAEAGYRLHDSEGFAQRFDVAAPLP